MSRRQEWTRVFNFHVEGAENYFVRACIDCPDVLVHNAAKCPDAERFTPVTIGETNRPRGPAPDNWRGRYIAQLRANAQPLLPDDWDAHHRIPRAFESHPEFQGFDFHDPSNIRGVKGSRSDTNIHQYITNEWEQFRRDHPNATRAQIEDFADSIDERYGEHWW